MNTDMKLKLDPKQPTAPVPTATAPPKDLRDRAEEIFDHHFGKIKVWIDDNDNVEITQAPILDAMLQFAAEVGEENRRKILECRQRIQELTSNLKLTEALMAKKHFDNMAITSGKDQRISELEQEVKRLKEGVVEKKTQNRHIAIT